MFGIAFLLSYTVLMQLKEREEKLEYWRKREKLVQEKKEKKKEDLRRQSSMWIDENKLEARILEALVDERTFL